MTAPTHRNAPATPATSTDGPGGAPPVPPPLRAWLAELDDAYLSDWANRGLLRRGRKLLDSLPGMPALISADGTGWHATLDTHRQTLDAPGFDHLDCSCPAGGPCHHLLAFLLALQRQAARTTPRPPGAAVDPAESPAPSNGKTATSPAAAIGVDADTAAGAPAPWLAIETTQLGRALGAAHLRRAHRLLLQALPVRLQETDAGLLAEIDEQPPRRVRIPRTLGLAGSLCSCGAKRCRHRALAVLAARRQAGPATDPAASGAAPAGIDALGPDQRQALDQTHDWLRELLLGGLGGLSPSQADRGEALATSVRQADLPRLAASIGGLSALQREELAGSSFVAGEHFRRQFAPLWLRLRALRQTPLPRPLPELGGSHRRHYRPAGRLRLTAVGAEYWRGRSGHAGLTLHFYCPARRRWYRHTQTRGAAQTAASDWSPQHCWQHERFAEAVPYRRLPGRGLWLEQGWVSADGRLSGRAGTLLTLTDDAGPADLFAAAQHGFAGAFDDYRRRMLRDPVDAPPPLPLLAWIAGADEPGFGALDQRWSQTLYDVDGRPLELALELDDPVRGAAADKLQRHWRRGERYRLLFGMLHYDPRRHRLQLAPIGFMTDRSDAWRHTTLV